MPLVPLVTNSAPSASLYAPAAGGGGGGPIGPNPVVSSITFAQNVGGPTAYTQGVLNMSSVLVIQDFGTPVQQDFLIQTGNPTPTDFTSSFVSTTNSFSVNGPGGDGNNANLNLVGSADGRTMITSLTAINAISSLTIVADPVVIPFNLQVSSINGQVPGGGGSGPNLTLSTLNVVGQGSISSLSVSSINGQVPGSAVIPADLVVSTLTFGANGIMNGISTINPAGQAMTISDGVNDASVSINLASNQTIFAIGSGGFARGSLQALGGTGPELIITGVNPSYANISISSVNTTISSLVVSSINGGAPGGGSTPFFSTLFTGTSTINCDGGQTQVLLPFDTTAGHLYQIQTQMSVQPRAGAVQTPGLGDYVIQEVLGQVYMNQTQGSLIAAADAASADIKIGCCSLFKSTGGPNQLDVIGSFSTTINMAYVALADFGPV